MQMVLSDMAVTGTNLSLETSLAGIRLYTIEVTVDITSSVSKTDVVSKPLSSRALLQVGIIAAQIYSLFWNCVGKLPSAFNESVLRMSIIYKLPSDSHVSCQASSQR